MQTRLRELLGAAEVCEPVGADGLQVFGLRWGQDSGLDYVTLDEALQAGTFVVTEVNEGGEVQTLKVANRSERRVLMVAGELLVGGMQNRTVNASLLVDGKKELKVPVSCVERGRWHYHAGDYGLSGIGSGDPGIGSSDPGFCSSSLYGSGSSSYGKVRARVSRSSSDSYKSTGAPISDQSAVWDEVDTMMCCLGSRSDSDALEQVYEDHAANLWQAVKTLHLPEDANGAVFVVGGKVVGVDLFDKPDTLSKLLPKLIRGYALDAMATPKGTPSMKREAVVEWLEEAADIEGEPFDSPGVGTDLRFASGDVVGACLMVEDRPVHVEMFDDAGRGGRALTAGPTLAERLAECERGIAEALEGQKSRAADPDRRESVRGLRAWIDGLLGRRRH